MDCEALHCLTSHTSAYTTCMKCRDGTDVKVGRVNGDKDFQSDSLAQRVNTVDRNVAIAKALLYHLPEHSRSTTVAKTTTPATPVTAAAAALLSSSSSDTTVSNSSSSSNSNSSSSSSSITGTTAATASASARNGTTRTDASSGAVAQHGVRRSVLPRALCFCASVQHAVDLAATLNDHGKNTIHNHTVQIPTTAPYLRKRCHHSLSC
jgi:hypothetical protein